MIEFSKLTWKNIKILTKLIKIISKFSFIIKSSSIPLSLVLAIATKNQMISITNYQTSQTFLISLWAVRPRLSRSLFCSQTHELQFLIHKTVRATSIMRCDALSLICNFFVWFLMPLMNWKVFNRPAWCLISAID